MERKHTDSAWNALLEFAKDALREIKEHALNDEQALCHVSLEKLVEAGEKAITEKGKWPPAK